MIKGVRRHIALIRGLVALYEAPGLFLRLYAYVRFSLFPYQRMAILFPNSGKLLDVGCGFGLWLHYLRSLKPDLELEGIDVDPRKISVAKKSRGRRIDFQLLDLVKADSDAYDSVCIVDVLCIVSEETKRSLTSEMFRVLKPGGELLLKDVDTKPRWKLSVAWLQEFVAVKIFGLSTSSGLDFRSARTFVHLLESTGFVDAKITRIDRWYPHPHVLITATRPMYNPVVDGRC